MSLSIEIQKKPKEKIEVRQVCSSTEVFNLKEVQEIRDAVLLGVPLQMAIRICGENPAKANGLWPQKGCIKEDSDGDILILDKELNIDTVIAKGRIMVQSGNVLVKGTFEE